MTRGLAALAAVAAVAVVVVLVLLGVRAIPGADHPETAVLPVPTAPAVPSAPPDAPVKGLYVRSEVGADGRVEVETWLRSATPVTELRLTTGDPELVPGSAEATDLDVRDLDGRVLAHRDSVGTSPQRIVLLAPATELYLTYTIGGGTDGATATVEGRTLARVLAVELEYAGAAGPVRRVVTAAGTVLNVACVRPGDERRRSPRPCGRATDDGGWAVVLRGAHRNDLLLAQLEA